ncbi:MAG: hypothetical protein C0592_14365 [Marinilabiliales bacterium]|nr:MAG: hypothetical protein C0592_14365 [Marinilabiliales bacterium]
MTEQTKFLVGIDDTDNLTSRGTGFIVRQLAAQLREKKIARVLAVSRHQLFVHDDIPYTSHNSSACMELLCSDRAILEKYCREYLLEVAAEGSDVGLCIIPFDDVDEDIIEWGLTAKKTVLNKSLARDLADQKNIFLEGLTGTHDGIIGSMAACGLRKHGSDGRILMLDIDFRSFSGQIKASEICNNFHIQNIFDNFGKDIPPEAEILLEENWKPILRNGRYTLIVEKDEQDKWKSISKDTLRKISS